MPCMAVSGVRISWETSAMTSFLVLLQFMMASDIRERCDDSIDGPGAASAPATAAIRKTYRRERASGISISRSTRARSTTRRRNSIGFLRQIQSPEQILACQALFRRAQNRRGTGVGKRDVSFGGSDDQAIVHAFQRQIHELSPFDQAGIQSANPFALSTPAREAASRSPGEIGPGLRGGAVFRSTATVPRFRRPIARWPREIAEQQPHDGRRGERESEPGTKGRKDQQPGEFEVRTQATTAAANRISAPGIAHGLHLPLRTFQCEQCRRIAVSAAQRKALQSLVSE